METKSNPYRRRKPAVSSAVRASPHGSSLRVNDAAPQPKRSASAAKKAIASAGTARHPVVTESCHRNRSSMAPAEGSASLNGWLVNGDAKHMSPSRTQRAPRRAPAPIIVVIDDRILVRDCLVQCFQLSYANYLVLPFATIDEWKGAAARHPRPSVIVLCTPSGRYVHSENADELGFLARTALAVPVIVVSDAEDAQHIISALKKGARGYIPTSMALNVAVEAVRLVEAGGTFVPAASLVPAGQEGHPLASINSMLTARQIMVLRALHSGKPNKQIAYELNMCESTVKVHIRHIMRKLKATNRTQVAVKATEFLNQ